MPAPNPVRELVKRELLDLAPQGTYQERVELFDNFKQRPVLAATLDPSTINQAALRLYTGANKDWVIAGTNAANAGSAIDVDGGCILTTAGADNDQMILRPTPAINSVAQSPWNTIEFEPEHGARFEAVIEVPALTAVLVQVGFGLTPVLDLDTDDDAAKFQFSVEGATSVANWTAHTSIGGTDAASDSGTIALAAKTIRLAVHISSSRVPRFYINGVKKHTGAALTAGANLIPFLGVQALAAAAKGIKVRSVRGSRLLTAAA